MLKFIVIIMSSTILAITLAKSSSLSQQINPQIDQSLKRKIIFPLPCIRMSIFQFIIVIYQEMMIQHLRKMRVQTVLKNPQFGFGLFNKFNIKKDYYDILGINKKASTQQIKDAFDSLAKEYNPNINKGFSQKFREVDQAQTILSDVKLRKEYDQARAFADFNRKLSNREIKESKQASGSQSSSQKHDWRWYLSQMSPEQQQMIKNRYRVVIQRVAIFGIGLVGLIIFLIIRFKKPKSSGNNLPIHSQSV